MNYYKEKPPSYFSNVRIDLISLLPHNKNNKILEIGAGSGDTLVKIKESGLGSETYGIELVELPNTNQNNPKIDKFIIGDIEKIEIDFPENYFDVIICGDVLEHLYDPWSVITKLTKHLKKGGIFIVSIPNIREILTLYKILVKADFQYSDSGILDKTHIRFFCKKNIINLMKTDKLIPINIYPGFQLRSTKKKIINKLTLGIFKDFLAGHYFVISKKISE